jgi:hypothetical protein
MQQRGRLEPYNEVSRIKDLEGPDSGQASLFQVDRAFRIVFITGFVIECVVVSRLGRGR